MELMDLLAVLPLLMGAFFAGWLLRAMTAPRIGSYTAADGRRVTYWGWIE